jgi:hypothetical protein
MMLSRLYRPKFLRFSRKAMNGKALPEVTVDRHFRSPASTDGTPAAERPLRGVYVDLRPPQPRDDGPTPVDTWLKAVRELCTLIDSLAEQGGVAAIAQRWSSAHQIELLEEVEALTMPLLAMREELRAVCATIDIAGTGEAAK